MEPLKRYLTRRFDSASITTALIALAASGESAELDEEHIPVLMALQRVKPELASSGVEGASEYLRSLDEDQIPGLVSNVKGVLHEMEYVAIENADGDAVYASMFSDPRHAGTDLQILDEATGEIFEVQLKATDQTAYVQDWIDAHPDGEILVTEEIAEKMGLESSGLSNESLEADVNEFVDELLTLEPASDLWDYFPALTLASISVVIWELWKRYRRGEISLDRFKWTAAKVAGLKVVKISALVFVLSIPVVGQVAGAVLVAEFLLGIGRTLSVHSVQ